MNTIYLFPKWATKFLFFLVLTSPGMITSVLGQDEPEIKLI